MRIVRFTLACFLVLCSLAAEATPTPGEALARAVALRHAGHLQQAIEQLRGLASSDDDAINVAARGELGAALVQARRYDEAEPLLRAAYAQSEGPARAWPAIELGNLAASRRQPADALRHYGEARALAGRDLALALTARINEARLAERNRQPELLVAISADAAGIADLPVRARLRLSIGALASRAGDTKLAWENLDQARALAAQTGNVRVEVAALDALAQLYEQNGRSAEALRLTQRAIARALAAATEPSDLLLRLEWRQGRLLVAQGASDEARAAYQRAVEHVERIRQDIPIEYESGRSSFRDTLEPLYLGYIDLLLKRAGDGDAGERVSLLRKARGIGELVKQSELQDYLGERCTVEAVQSDAQVRTTPGTAVVYPIVLPDRIELLFESAAGIHLQTTPIAVGDLRQLVTEYTRFLRDDNAPPYLAHAQQLYDLLIRPFADQLAAQQVHTLLVVPDGVLRLVPWATLHDGKQFLIERYSVVINSGLTLTSQSAAASDKAFSALLAGMAEPGPVVEKLGELRVERLLQPTTSRSLVRRTGAVRQFSAVARAMAGRDVAQLRENLALPGVKVEVEMLSTLLPGVSLLDSGFTTTRLHDELAKGEYRIAHVATHGYFGSTADESFIMAYDNLVTMDDLQKLLQLEGVRKTPIELLTLSACETAEGDDRSPLGIAGAALKARARSALGSLWSVSDDAAQKVMQTFYAGLVRDGLTKAEALRRAQMALLGDAELKHPFYWAPFILVGNWR